MRFALVSCLLLIAGPSWSAELKLATWNLNWLTTRHDGMPADVVPRQPEDFDRLRTYASDLRADVVALQEVDGPAAARLVFPPEAWSIHMSRDHVIQRVGFAVRRGLTYSVNPDVTAIGLEPEAHLRGGADITLRSPDGPLRLLAVHLKTGCQYARTGPDMHPACRMLLAQFDAVSQWIAARQAAGEAFVILGDFNRGLDQTDAFTLKLRTAAPMIRATEGYSSPCWGQAAFIDHILIGGPARDRVIPASLRVLGYKETEPAWKQRLSDHCPVSVRLSVPD